MKVSIALMQSALLTPIEIARQSAGKIALGRIILIEGKVHTLGLDTTKAQLPKKNRKVTTAKQCQRRFKNVMCLRFPDVNLGSRTYDRGEEGRR